MAPGLESVGLVDGADSAERLIADVEAAASIVPPAAGDPAAAAQLNPQGTWPLLTPPLVDIASDVVFPRWHIQPAERKAVSEALSECLEQVFPGGIDGPYACWVRLVVACGAIVTGRVMQHGHVPPLFFAKVQPAPKPAHDPMTVTSLTQ